MTAAVLVAWAAALVALHSGGDTKSSTEFLGATIPSWISAIGASLAFLLTFTLFLQGRRDRIREQVNLVYATETISSHDGDLRHIKATVINGSTAPIWEVEVLPRWDDEGIDVDLYQLRPAVEPGHSLSGWEWKVDKEEMPSREQPPRVVFSDQKGRRWEKVGTEAINLNSWRGAMRRVRWRWEAWRER